ncbi:hypothetical protein QF042_003764 [Pedobacter sp. W3I1]|uniref:hypothetical protein n=1 Tax=Pedobacter sp. W3I1 TaxID=3042291 RepID=UPI00277E523B|nr:hypothetical protein [Pedobacter sp. W3I1]MDQ0640199.1 hypothetical protein [Pedobacter sp. W3I1]
MNGPLEQLVKRVRKLMKDPDMRRPNNIHMGNFPGGCCESGSVILACILKDNQFGDWDLVCDGTLGRSHCWLELDDLIIDITADQFDPNIDKWIFKKGQKYLSKKFKETRRKKASQGNWDLEMLTVLKNVRTRI